MHGETGAAQAPLRRAFLAVGALGGDEAAQELGMSPLLPCRLGGEFLVMLEGVGELEVLQLFVEIHGW